MTDSFYPKAGAFSMLGLTLMGLLLMASPLLAEDLLAENQEPKLTDLNIQADQMTIDKEKQFSRYKGHVQIQLEDKQLWAEQVDLFFQQGALSKMIATGTPVIIKMDNTLGNIEGTAKKITFSLTNKKIILQHEALLFKNEDRFSGELIEYDLEDHKISARKAPASSEQVKMTIKIPAQQ